MGISERFWKHVDVRGENECWMWNGGVQRGYGAVRLTFPGGIRRMVNANRVAFAITYGPMQDSEHVMHSCDTPLCVNPKHLSVGSRTDNMRDASAKGRMGRVASSPRRLSQAEKDAIVASLRRGNAVRATARQFGVAPVTVRRYMIDAVS